LQAHHVTWCAQHDLDLMKKRLSIFASGSGSNAEKFFEYFKDHSSIEIVSVFTNNRSAGVIERADRFQIPHHVFNRTYWQTGEEIIKILKEEKVDFIVLAGFMLLIPQALTQQFPNQIFNIHPALLPKYGGKGMYGMNVHDAVKAAGEKESGITIHFVNEEYDKGEILYQESVEIDTRDTAEDIARKVLAVEHKNYPGVVEKVVLKST
jgi:phosphoribosylglycinamide formyltransferase-1